MLPVIDTKNLRENTGFLSQSGHKIAAPILSDFVWGGFGYGRGDAVMALQ